MFTAFGQHGDVPETTFLRFHIADYLDSFDSETDYIGLMISNVKFRNKWSHDARRHKFISFRNSNGNRRQKRYAAYARKTQDTWQTWRKRIQAPTTTNPETMNADLRTETVGTAETPTVEYEHEEQYQTTPKPFFIPTRTTYEPNRRPNYSRRTYTTKMTSTSAIPSAVPTTTSKYSIPRQTDQFKKVQIEPGTILMMNSTYLHDKYISTGRATTFHRALLMDYFGLSESDMERMGMTVVAWGFSYQVVDKKFPGRKVGQAEKFFCDFKFRSFTFNAGYVGAKVNIEFGQYQG